ncbi:hypothetical protein Tco_0200146 [Tanacetum coccineum]
MSPKTKSETTESSAGSGSGSMKDVLNEELRQKIQAGKSAYEAKKVKEQSATELNELQFLTIDADSLPEPKKTIIKNKQAQIMAKYHLFPYGVSAEGSGVVVEGSASFLEEAIATPPAAETKASSV